MPKRRFHRCSCCDNIAVWLYMPGSKGKIYFCDNCVPRGCSCNLLSLTEFPKTNNGITSTMYWNSNDVNQYILGNINNDEFEALGSKEKKNDSAYYEILDDCGKRNPCCEYEYSSNGFEIDIPDIMIKKHDLLNCIGKVRDSYFLYRSNINWIKLIIYLRDNFGNNINYHTIFDEIEKNIIDNFVTIDTDTLTIPLFLKKKRIAKTYVDEIRNLAREFKFKQYHI